MSSATTKAIRQQRRETLIIALNFNEATKVAHELGVNPHVAYIVNKYYLRGRGHVHIICVGKWYLRDDSADLQTEIDFLLAAGDATREYRAS